MCSRARTRMYVRVVRGYTLHAAVPSVATVKTATGEVMDGLQDVEFEEERPKQNMYMQVSGTYIYTYI